MVLRILTLTSVCVVAASCATDDSDRTGDRSDAGATVGDAAGDEAGTGFDATSDPASSDTAADGSGGGVLDETPPEVQFVLPLDGASVAGYVILEVVATDNTAVDRVELRSADEPLTTLDASPYTYSWDTTALMAGRYLVTATAYDLAGESALDTVTLRLQGECSDGDCPPSSVRIINPVDEARVCGSLTIEVIAVDDVAIDSVEIEIDDVRRGVAEDPPYRYDWDTTVYDNGVHTVRAVAYDTAEQPAFGLATWRPLCGCAHVLV